MKRVMCAALLALGMALMPISTAEAVAGGLPRFDTETYCEDVTRAAGGARTFFRTCVIEERRARTALAERWPDLPEPARDRCTGLIERLNGAYQLLETCIHQSHAPRARSAAGTSGD